MDRAACPVDLVLSCRAVARSRNQELIEPFSTTNFLLVGKPSASNGLDLSPLDRCGSSIIVIPDEKICFQRASLRKLVPRAIELPFRAFAR